MCSTEARYTCVILSLEHFRSIWTDARSAVIGACFGMSVGNASLSLLRAACRSIQVREYRHCTVNSPKTSIIKDASVSSLLLSGSGAGKSPNWPACPLVPSGTLSSPPAPPSYSAWGFGRARSSYAFCARGFSFVPSATGSGDWSRQLLFPPSRGDCRACSGIGVMGRGDTSSPKAYPASEPPVSDLLREGGAPPAPPLETGGPITALLFGSPSTRPVMRFTLARRELICSLSCFASS
mmetsp:Transcript_34455/g.85836  ORF Transcript_34455/g.85836 Transcript_34455/m.85836 type:complete len:238 (+) Transcript_34455:1191-1904(+)